MGHDFPRRPETGGLGGGSTSSGLAYVPDARALVRALVLARGAGVVGVDRARAALARSLCRFRSPDDWRFSDLTGDGYPVELVFSSGRAGFRYTVEAAGAQATPAARLASAARHMDDEPGRDLVRWLGAWAGPEGPPRADTVWIGGRHDRAGDRFKIYLAADGWEDIRRAIPDPADFPAPAARRGEPRMIAFEPSTGIREVYCRLDDPEPWHVKAQVGGLGWPSAGSELLELVEEAAQRSVRRELPASRVGLSWTFSDDGAPVAFSLFLFARSVFGSDQRIREGVLRLADRLRWDVGAYEAISRPLAARTSRLTRHGLVAFTVRNAEPGVTWGLRPPPDAGEGP